VHRAQGKASWFPALQQGPERRRGQPAQPHGLKTDYLWKSAHARRARPTSSRTTRRSSRRKDPRTAREAQAGVAALPPTWRCAAGAVRCGSKRRGKRYLIQHSAGSGKSNSIALASRIS
jgi:type I restriction enzyme R subunit